MSFLKMTDLDLAGKRVLIRADLNVKEYCCMKSLIIKNF